ncbi:MAG: undecaprenyl-phosphate glucose phosphotransferase [Thiomicrospira sp. CG2_30_44_34]|nr:MAG: undecaprenyl-phosphate glucose phosphotransferase [Thiomicrospira sp. CG2_30_44_34]
MITLKTENSGFVWTHRITDLLLPITLLKITLLIYSIPWHDRYLTAGILGGFAFVTSAQMVGIYQNWQGRNLTSSAYLIIKAWLLTWTFLIVLAFLFKDAEGFSRLAMVTWAIVTLFTLVLYRFLVRRVLGHYRQQGKNSRNIAIVGAGKVGQHLAGLITQNPWLGYKIVGFFDDNPNLSNTNISNFPILGNTLAIQQAAKNHQFDELYICLPLRAEAKIKSLLNELTDTTTIVKFIPDLFSFDLMHAQWTDLKGLPVISVYDTPLNSSTARMLKRFEDVTLSTLILTLISPIMIALAIGVKLTSPGPVFYRQVRVGWNGKNFNMLKFRSMPVNIEKDGVQWGSAKTKTNTKFGQFIRATSLDELPQFLNVLLGDMSIVGPRPERDIFVEQFRKQIPRYMQKHMVKAGITGWAQINGWRGDTDLSKRVEFDLHYINNWSLWLDIKIVVLTIFKGFINKNAC